MPPSDPFSEYSSRLHSLKLQQSTCDLRHKRLGYIKLVIVLSVLAIIARYFKSHTLSLLYLFPSAVAFIALEFVHSHVLRSLNRCSVLTSFYQRALARLNNQWHGTGESGDAFLDPAHPYARDLDIFGKGSLFELLCTARTSSGQQILADWLKQPAPLEEIAARQQAITELNPQLDLRAELDLLTHGVRSRVRPDALTAWAESPPVLDPKPARFMALFLCLLWLSTLVIWAVWNVWQFAFLIAAVNLIVHSRFKPHIEKIVAAEQFEDDLRLLASVLHLLETNTFSSPRLAKLKSALSTSGVPPSHSIHKVRRLIESLESRRNLVLAPTDPFVLWSAQLAFAIELWRQKFGHAVRGWLAAVGEMEALMSLATYVYEHPDDVFPEFTSSPAFYQAEALSHPLLPRQQAVPNDLTLGGDVRVIIISGPNMAGKSTLVRAVGINAVLAQCGAPVRARKLRLSPLQLAASICILDSLQGGVSRFYAEISRLKLMVELTQGPLPVLFLLDELLGGTNSHDRRVGAEAIVKILVSKKAIGMITTHDLALTLMADNMNGHARNFHFEDRLENGQLHFDYKLTPGVARSSNALNLMRSIGLQL
jgi:DNA mismatch repair ATPase MutS